MTDTTARRYDSSLRRARAGETRATVLAAATRLFVERGWTGTSMRDVARAAGCAVETVYATVGTKRNLLEVVVDVAVVGDDEPVPLLERPEFLAISEGDPRQRAEAFARLGTPIYRRTARLHRVLVEAANTDSELAEFADRDYAAYRTSMRACLHSVAGRPITDDEFDTVCAVLGREVYLQLTERSGWTDDRYRIWVADIVLRLLDLVPERKPWPPTPH
ncbi:TetR/AcrR family transcriptional regulator [Nocardia sp. NPDC058379]|uniref:TetR/AcrR family transcriptional regulator n=1 Tax=unclassified Nocardia TaxID=2637762 RepID=UPI00366A5361